MPSAMLYTEATSDQIATALLDPAYVAEQKLDGVRCLLAIEDGTARLLNRKGEQLKSGGTTAARDRLAGAIAAAVPAGTFVLDGELVDDRLWLFDVVEAGALVGPGTPFSERRLVLETLFSLVTFPADVQLVAQARTTDEKLALWRMVQETGREGIMLKLASEPYSPRRSKKSLKAKCVKTVDVVVTELGWQGRENAVLAVWKDGALVEVGRTSMIGKEPVAVGDVIEVKTLYLGANGRLYQPRMMRVRHDKASHECHWSQLENLYTNKEVAA